MSKNQENMDPILSAFTATKGEQLDLLSEESNEKPTVKRGNVISGSAENTAVQEKEARTVYESAEGVQYSEEEWLSPVTLNGPTRQEVEEWKERHGEVFFTPFGRSPYVWRTLKRPEYREIISDTTLTALDREEFFTEKCILFPRNFSLEKIKKSDAGVPSLLSEMIMDKSGFVAQSAPIKL